MNRMLAASCIALAIAVPASAKEPAQKKSPQVIRIKGDEKTPIYLNKDHRLIRLKDGEIFVNGDPIRRGFLGVRLMSLTEELRTHFGAPKDSGVLVSSVTADSPAAKAGIEVGDVITSIDGTTASSPMAIERAIAGKNDGDRVQVEVIRNRGPRTLSASIDQREAKLMDLSSLDRLPAIIDSEMLRAKTFKFNEQLNSPEWRERMTKITDCTSVQGRIKDLEKRLEDLEKKRK